ncbi:hypothetical protein TSAR_003053, partial [Trichomalopsis sarcophagae]
KFETRSISIKFDMYVYFLILNSRKTFIFYFWNTLFSVFLNHPIVTNNSANMHLKENKITYFFPFGPRDRPLCSTDKMKMSSGSTALFGR